ncbi:hypothetical protein MF672_050070 [Actinomadura sp. ATCC 31491]|uniref:Tetratricopeptide repeat protein n=1 Tax=Actinomadura luzonensis TaxID=2805427 RepID=A0ABT0GBB3_9ACTN|nr:hypothetical protein [Actinomadura luzonensis]MCK2221905.1 hypothetical protein [Actinomadura luzonensis]
MDERLERAGVSYERAVFWGDAGGLEEAERGLDGVEADLALARGRLAHARFLGGGEEAADDGERSAVERAAVERESVERTAFERAAFERAAFERAVELYRRLGDVRGEAEALFWVAIFHQVVRGDQESARPLLERARELAVRAGDRLTLSYVLRHQGIAEHVAGRLAAARELLEESTRLRREVGFPAGVAANLVGLAYVAGQDGRPDEAGRLLDEARAVAGECGADAVLRQVEEAAQRLR